MLYNIHSWGRLVCDVVCQYLLDRSFLLLDPRLDPRLDLISACFTYFFFSFCIKCTLKIRLPHKASTHEGKHIVLISIVVRVPLAK